MQIDNAIAPQTKYLRLRYDTWVKNMNEGMREEMKAAEQDAVGVLVNPFDLVDGLDPRPTMGDIPPHEESQIIVVNIVTSSQSR